MCNCQNSAFFEFGRDDLLNELVVFLVDVGSSFIDQDNLALLEESSTNTQELFLTNRKTVISHLSIKPAFFFNNFKKIALFDNIHKLFRSVRHCGIKIFSESSVN